ncbi:hypothetical protein CONLIGDRAFT_622323 [Coniochaeta ligniaria NRRL 30616]|uniref:HECT-type E3 ubiquitin transferase n=1 Tax=Coniochaeta ligniaria NRRL 30616 TaxID=1408157 RepID=A0A1J7IB30_9PEZI|nr:hypothetical protein CONLIGDRAFT_622323 [Coniochaeta ligniaria NRRL 30616]
MTRDTPRPVGGGGGHSSTEMDLLAGLWEEAPFARLPVDAPTELRALVEDIDNPKRVYSIHRASRRHNFQQLVQKYVVQLREGCGADFCTTPTCFTCRKRIVGKAPIRRYNLTSARTLAVYLASQDDPENGLCPTLKLPKGPPAALRSLLIVPLPKAPIHDDWSHRTYTNKNGEDIRSQHKGRAGDVSPPSQSRNADDSGPLNPAPRLDTSKAGGRRDEEGASASPERILVRERPIQKDYRSFAANMFETVAFRMLEWLTPSGMEAMVRDIEPEHGAPDNKADSQDPQAAVSDRPTTELDTDRPVPKRPSSTGPLSNDAPRKGQMSNGAAESARDQDPDHGDDPPSSLRPVTSRRNSKATVRTSSAPMPKRQLSIDAYPQDGTHDDPLLHAMRSPLVGSHTEKNPRSVKPGNGTIPRPISQLTTAGYFDDVSLEKMPSPKAAEVKSKVGRSQMDGTISSGSSSPKEVMAGSKVPSDASSDKSQQMTELENDLSLQSLYPQTLTRLNAFAVDFICDVLQDYGVAEKHMLHPKTVSSFHVRQRGQPRPLKRLKLRSRPNGKPNLRREWTLFAEQTIFFVLSDAQRAVWSFTEGGSLYDSQTLWYCMLRLTRVAPTLVFHSLWLAAASLFAPPNSVHSLRSPTAKLFPRHLIQNSLSNEQAGSLLSVCMHCLVAAAPMLSDSNQLYDMSRIRSHGLSLAGSGAIARQPAEVCLQYDDAFSNDLALRLARRLFSAITARRSFADLNQVNLGPGDDAETDILDILFSQLDFLNMDAAYILNFSVSDRALHETRVPTLLLDWARAVMLHDWDGNPEVPGDGPFGGALALIEAMFKKRQTLLLGDTQFRSEYFAERLDAVDMPVSWISHVSTKQKAHLLDFPYIFSPSTLVSYFRSINFSRMSRAYEEASSLNGRVQTIMMQGNLIMQQRHKRVLQDMLTTASSKYLVLSIDRDSVVKDSFDQLWRREERELLRPLKVHLGEGQGEEGFDSGGVQQEFFRLAFAEALDPAYGAFAVDDRTRMTWFRASSPEELWKFELVGLLVSLAVYNGLTLPVTFPKALYRKLMGEGVTELHHIADGWPDLASGLTQLLEWDEKDGLVEDVFARTYEFSVEAFGQPITREMKSNKDEEEPWPQFPKTAEAGSSSTPLHTANPDDTPLVTSANRNAYVYDYIRYLTDVSVRPQYEAFARGFRTCFHPKSLTLLTSNILQSLVEGVQEIDVSELRRYTRYVGWDAGHRSVKDFWSIVKRYDERMKRKLLEFVTASDRLPVGGVKNLNFVIQKNGIETEEGGHLPTAYTCYGTLLLPEYKDKDALRERLAMALENAQGFGFA